MLKYNPNTKNTARTLRKNMTDAERKLWQHLRRDQVQGFRFYRQRRIGNYIVDFYCPKLKLVIEVDGDQHCNSKGVESDKNRSDYLREQNLIVYRINNVDIYNNIDGVMQSVYELVNHLKNKH